MKRNGENGINVQSVQSVTSSELKYTETHDIN